MITRVVTSTGTISMRPIHMRPTNASLTLLKLKPFPYNHPRLIYVIVVHELTSHNTYALHLVQIMSEQNQLANEHVKGTPRRGLTLSPHFAGVTTIVVHGAAGWQSIISDSSARRFTEE